VNALLIGCGNIGALYDWETPEIKTFAKALNYFGFNFSVYDLSYKDAQRVGIRYGAKILQSWDEIPIQNYDLVIISSPTDTHYSYLEALLKSPPRLIICEKPVDNHFLRLGKILRQYEQSSTRVMVNYHRRYQPKMFELLTRVRSINSRDACQKIVVNYQRGFLNNCSHAIDLLEFIFDRQFIPAHPVVLESVVDEFFDDPTMSVSCTWEGVNVLFVGLAHAQFSHFEINLFFQKEAINIYKGGDEIEFFSTQDSGPGAYNPLESVEVWRNVLKDPMKNVISHAVAMLGNPVMPDNFLGSVNLSREMLRIMRGVS
jgi:predicted dehydrogenase